MDPATGQYIQVRLPPQRSGMHVSGSLYSCLNAHHALPPTYGNNPPGYCAHHGSPSKVKYRLPRKPRKARSADASDPRFVYRYSEYYDKLEGGRRSCYEGGRTDGQTIDRNVYDLVAFDAGHGGARTGTGSEECRGENECNTSRCLGGNDEDKVNLKEQKAAEYKCQIQTADMGVEFVRQCPLLPGPFTKSQSFCGSSDGTNNLTRGGNALLTQHIDQRVKKSHSGSELGQKYNPGCAVNRITTPDTSGGREKMGVKLNRGGLDGGWSHTRNLTQNSPKCGKEGAMRQVADDHLHTVDKHEVDASAAVNNTAVSTTAQGTGALSHQYRKLKDHTNEQDVSTAADSTARSAEGFLPQYHKHQQNHNNVQEGSSASCDTAGSTAVSVHQYRSQLMKDVRMDRMLDKCREATFWRGRDVHPSLIWQRQSDWESIIKAQVSYKPVLFSNKDRYNSPNWSML